MSLRKAGWVALYCAVSGAAAAQQAPPPKPAPAPIEKSTAQSEAGDPIPLDASPSPAAATPPVAPAPAPAGHGPAGRPASGPAAGSGASTAEPAAATSGKPGANKVDRLNLGTATVTGDREQPKVMYIVPWKRSDIGDLSGKPMNSLVDEILAPVDRDVFKREVVYYHALQSGPAPDAASQSPAQQGEK
jgi:hypothetical protein